MSSTCGRELLASLSNMLEVPGKPFVWWREYSRYYAGHILHSSSRSDRFLVKCTDGFFNLIYRQNFVKTNVPQSVFLKVIESFPQLNVDFEVFCTLYGQNGKPHELLVTRFQFVQGKKIGVYVSGQTKRFDVSLDRLKVVPKTEEETNEEKVPIDQSIPQHLFECLKQHRPFVWFKDNGSNVCGHEMIRNNEHMLVRSMHGEFIRKRIRNVSECDLPDDIRDLELSNMIRSLPVLLEDFQLKAKVKGYYMWSPDKYVPAKILRLGASKVRVQVNDEEQWIDVSALKSDTECDTNDGADRAAAEKMNNELKRVTTELEQAQQNACRLETQLTEARAITGQFESRCNDLSQQLETSKNDATQKQQKIRRLEQTKNSQATQITQIKNENQRVLREKQREINDRDAEMQTAIEDYGSRIAKLNNEKNELREEVNDGKRHIRKLEESVDAISCIEEQRDQAINRLEEEQKEKNELRKQLTEYRLQTALGNPILDINLVAELDNLRDQEHSFACDALEELSWDLNNIFNFLYEVFFFADNYFKNHLEKLRGLLKMNDHEQLDNLFTGHVQMNYLVMMDLDGLVAEFKKNFGERLGDSIDDRLIRYVRSCGRLCWIRALKTRPAKMVFRFEKIGNENIPFDPAKFVEYETMKGKRNVVQIVLPGLYRIDSDRALGLPVVLTERPRRRTKEIVDEVKEEEDSGVLRFEDLRDQLKPIEEQIWKRKKRTARKMFEKLKIDVSHCELIIGCAAEGCEYIHASSFAEYSEKVFRHPLCCEKNEDHEGVRILRIAPYEE